jgi:hypothetical protein
MLISSSWKVQMKWYRPGLVSLRLNSSPAARGSVVNFLTPLGAESSLTSWTSVAFSSQCHLTVSPAWTVSFDGP